ncbi:hypothetical protein SUDANB105_07295 [Streptomyces sp. enrichment culture]
MAAVGLGQADGAERDPAARGRLGQPDPRGPLGAPGRLQSGQHPVGAADHAPGHDGGGGAGLHPVRLGVQGGGLAFGARPLAGPTPFVGVPLRQVRGPAGVVDVDRGARGVQVKDPVHDVGEQGGVVADHHESARVALEEAAQPGDRVGVQVVGRFVEQQRAVVSGEQDAGQFHPALLPAGQVADRPAQHPVRQAQSGRHPGGLGLRGVAAAGLEGGFGAGVGVHRPLQFRRGAVVGHRGLGPAQCAQRAVEPAGRQDPVGDGDGGVGGTGVLGQEADRAGAGDGSRGRPGPSGQGGQQGGLPRAVAADEADPVARGDGEGDVGQQQARADAQLDTTSSDHGMTLRKSERTHFWRGSGSSARRFGASTYGAP